MRFNKFVWDLYKISEKGKKEIEKYSLKNDYSDIKYWVVPRPGTIEKLQNASLNNFVKESKVNWHRIFCAFFQESELKISNLRDVYTNWLNCGIEYRGYVLVEKESYEFWATMQIFTSNILFSIFSDYFFPFNLDCEFNKFQSICVEFNIPIPEVPKRRDWKGRALYYIDLCDALFEFRKINGFTSGELCAFLYDFAPAVMKDLEDTEVPNPSKVWFVGGHKGNFEELDVASDNTIYSWQGNVDAKRGDIVVMYCLTPRSYIHSIWRVIGDGFADPFFYYYSVMYITNPLKLDACITINELKSNKIWANSPLIRKNLQGVNGAPIKYSEYIELLSMLKTKGQNIEVLPIIKPTNRFERDDFKDERDVEIRLIEPFLELINYKHTDWVRQMPVKMGRGERNYPDYCFGANTKRGDEMAKMIIESKYEIKTQKDLQEAYFQAKSYAIRLQSDKFVLASREGIWIYEPKNGNYKFDQYIHYNWVEIENPDVFHLLKLKIGKQ